MKLLAAKQWNKIFYENGQKHRIKVIAELVHRDGNSNAYFSITGDVERQAKNNRWMPFLSGCIHQEIIEHFPQLQPLVDMHLADEDGVPMHAYSNAAYWAGQTKWQSLDLDILSKHLRVTKDQAAALQRQTETRIKQNGHFPDAAWEYVLFNAAQNHIWAVEAERALLMLNTTEESK